jgi:ParB family chromosome partitioning protein
MTKKRPQVSLSQAIRPHTGDLDRLFTGEEDVEQASGLQLLAIRIDAIVPDPDQPRSTFPPESLEELSKSIQQDGVIQPIEVAEIRPNIYKIVHGERRWRAARLAGLTAIPAVVRRRDYDQLTRFVRQIVENIQREDLNDIDRAAGLLRLRALMDEELQQARDQGLVEVDKPWASKITWAKVGERLGYSRQRIQQLIRLLALPDEIKDAVREGALSERDTRIYQGMRPVQQRALYRALAAGDLSPAEAREVARFLRGAPDLTVHKALRILRSEERSIELPFEDLPTEETTTLAATGQAARRELHEQGPAGVSVERPSGVERLTWAYGHLIRARVSSIRSRERGKAASLLQHIRDEVDALLEQLAAGDKPS